MAGMYKLIFGKTYIIPVVFYNKKTAHTSSNGS